MDVLIRGAVVYDGSGAAGSQLDVAVRGERILAVGPEAATGNSGRVLDAGGLALAPGFIDLHSHADLTLPAFPRATNSLSQGVTTELVGLCGFSPAPVSMDATRAEQLRRFAEGIGPDLDWAWRDFGSFLDRLELARPAVNVAALVGHGALRIAAMGTEDRAPTPVELAAMRADLRAALGAGAWGMSSGLVYVPGAFCTTDELLAIGEELRQADALYVSHIRNEGDHLLEAVGECLTIGERLGIRCQVSHLKSTGRRNAGKMFDALQAIEAARQRGVRAHADVYPYTAGSTFLHQVLPVWVKDGGLDRMVERLRVPEQRGRVRHDIEHGLPGWGNQLEAAGGWHNVLVVSVGNPARQDAEGRRVADLARQAALDPLDYALDLLVDDRGRTVMVNFTINESDMHAALRSPLTAIGSDQLGVTSPTARVHPRAYGTFVRVLGWGVREAGLFRLETAIHKMTGLSADILGLRDRGRVRPGLIADLVLFDPAAVRDRATYEDPTLTAEGIEHVLLGGQLVVEGGRVRHADRGRVLRPGAS